MIQSLGEQYQITIAQENGNCSYLPSDPRIASKTCEVFAQVGKYENCSWNVKDPFQYVCPLFEVRCSLEAYLVELFGEM